MPIFFAYLADLLMLLASLGAAAYCMILSRRLSRLTSFDQGIGGAIAVLSAQVDEMKSALADAKAGSDGAGQHLSDLVVQARDISSELELMIAACHDFAEEALVVQGGEKPNAIDQVSTAPIPEKPDSAKPPALPQEVKTKAPAVSDTDLPVFGSRRKTAAQPMFRHGLSASAAE